MKENGFDSIKGKDIFDEAYQVITDAIAKQNQLANPSVPLDEFVQFCSGELY